MNNITTIRGKISTLSIQYVAGFFDGEGCVNIYQTKKGVKKDRIGYQLTTSIFNSDKEVVEKLKKSLGGYIQIRKRNTDKWKDGYVWRLITNHASKFLKEILPFLIIKKEQAKVAIEFQELRQRKTYQFGRNPKEVEDFYEFCYQKMRLLNKKGKKAYYPQRLNEEALNREVIVRTALKNAEIGRNDLSALQENVRKGGYAVLKKYGRKHYQEMRSKVRKQQ